MKVLLRTDKSAYLATTRGATYPVAHHKCKTCSIDLGIFHVVRRVKSRIVARFCEKCFEGLLISNRELK